MGWDERILLIQRNLRCWGTADPTPCFKELKRGIQAIGNLVCSSLGIDERTRITRNPSLEYAGGLFV